MEFGKHKSIAGCRPGGVAEAPPPAGNPVAVFQSSIHIYHPPMHAAGFTNLGKYSACLAIFGGRLHHYRESDSRVKEPEDQRAI